MIQALVAFLLLVGFVSLVYTRAKEATLKHYILAAKLVIACIVAFLILFAITQTF